MTAMPASSSAVRTVCRSVAAVVTCQLSPWSSMSSAPASSAASMRSSSVAAAFSRMITPLRSNCHATAPGSASEPAVPGEHVLHLGTGAVAVVGERLDVDGDAVRGVALVGDALVRDAFELAGTALDGPLDVVLGHRRVARLLHHRAQRRVRLGVTAAVARRDLDLAGEPREQLPRAASAAPFWCLIECHLE